MGPFGSNIKAENFTTSGVPVIKGGNLNGTYIHDSFTDFLTEDKAAELASSQARPLDIVITHRGTLGQVGLIPERSRYPYYVVSQSQLKLSFDQAKVDPYFIYYFLRSPLGQQRLLANTSQVGVPAIAQALTTIRQIQIALPSLEEQRNICSMLRLLDDRITLLRETNATLEAIAQALFKSWFVDFDPVRAKMEGRMPEGMDEATAALFPDGFETSELGEVPRGWRVGCIDDICSTVTNGGTPSRSKTEYWEQGTIPWFKTGEFHDGFLLQPSERITNAALIGSSVKLLPKDAVLMAIYAAPTVGRLGILVEPATFNQACTGMVARNEVGPWFLFWTLFNGRDWFNSRANGAAQQNISKAIVSAYRTVIPPNPVLDSFNLVASGIHEAIRMNTEKAMTLSTLRDTLLPRLISGQLRLPEAQATTEAALGGVPQA